MDIGIEIWKWTHDRTNEGVDLYATVGATDQRRRGGEERHRIEIFTGLMPAEDDIARALAMLASFPEREVADLDHGHTATFMEPLWQGTEMRSFLVLRQLSDIIPVLRLQNGVHVEFLQAIPVFPSEVAFKKAHGADALLQHWEAKAVPFWDPTRVPEPALSPSLQ